MINLKIICVGKIKEKSLENLINEYIKRISKYAKIEVIELEDEKLPNSFSLATQNQIKQIECEKIKNKLDKIGKSTVFALDLTGKEYDSVSFAKKIEEISIYSSSTISFVIGGSLGLSVELLSMCDYKICFSKMTFPHQLIRLFLTEQLFRSFKILNNETYHH
jgi:23S rRNA (pseudouridine1915-N3)-methyltransferase